MQQAEIYPTCHAIACRMVVSRRAEMGEAGFRHYLGIQVKQRQHQAALEAATAARKLTESEENATAWSTLRARLPAALTSEPLQLVIPSGPARARRPGEARRARYRAHVTQVAHAAAAMPADAAPVVEASSTEASSTEVSSEEAATIAAASPLPGQLCALCGGGCCTRGSDHAYLIPATLRRFMDAQPRLSLDEVVAAYVDRIAARTQSGSCINHTRGGCSLPRAMRSDTCNAFACESLARLQAAQQGAHPLRAVLVVRRKQDQWQRADPALDNAIDVRAVLRDETCRIQA